MDLAVKFAEEQLGLCVIFKSFEAGADTVKIASQSFAVANFIANRQRFLSVAAKPDNEFDIGIELNAGDKPHAVHGQITNPDGDGFGPFVIECIGDNVDTAAESDSSFGAFFVAVRTRCVAAKRRDNLFEHFGRELHSSFPC